MSSFAIQVILPGLAGGLILVLCARYIVRDRARVISGPATPFIPPPLKSRSVPPAEADAMRILDRYSSASRIAGLFDKNPPGQQFTIDQDVLRERLADEALGHPAMIDDVVKQVTTRALMVERTEPLAAFLFAGPPSSGKSAFAKALAHALPGYTYDYHDCSQYKGENSGTLLFGAEPGFKGSDKLSPLMAGLIANPRTAIVFDEIEKAHPSVRERFLTALEEGFFQEQTKKLQVPTTDAVFLFTSNAAQNELVRITANSKQDRDQLSDQCKKLLDQHLGDAFLRRIHHVFPVPLIHDQPLAMAELTLKFFARACQKFGLTLAEPDGMHDDVLIKYTMAFIREEAEPRKIRRQLEREIGDLVPALRAKEVTRVRVAPGKAGRGFTLLKAE